MSKRIDIIDEDQDVYDREIEDTDFGLVISKNGSLKSLFLPDDDVEIPREVREVLAMFGVSDLTDVVQNHTIH